MKKEFNLGHCSALFIKLLPALSLTSLISCASSPLSEVRQKIDVSTVLASGAYVDGVTCDLKNERGAWSVVTPNSVEVVQSEMPLQVVCRKDGYSLASTTIVKQTEGRVLGDLGGLGKLVVGGSTTARPPYMNSGSEISKYPYASPIKIVMTPLPLETSPAKSLSNNESTSQKKTFDFEDAKSKCEDIGLRKGTESFGLCVMKLIN